MVMNEGEWIQRARGGDSEAFAALVLAHQTFVYNLALRALGDPIEAQDLAQEAFLRAWTGLVGFRGQAKFRTWLYRIVLNLCYNRRPRLRRELAEPLPDELPHPGSQTPAGLEWEYDQAEQRRWLQEKVEQLPSAYRVLVLLRYRQDLSYEEIAEVMSMPLGTVKTGLFRAKALLRAALQPHEEVLEWNK